MHPAMTFISAIRCFISTTSILILIHAGSLTGQQILDDRYLSLFKRDMQVLASDSLEGRETGTMGELHAALYIADRFEVLGIKPWFNGCYYQDFDFPDGYQYQREENHIQIYSDTAEGRKVLRKLSTDDFTPLPWGSNTTVAGEVAYAGYCLEGFIQAPGTGKKKKKGAFPAAALRDYYAGKILLVRYDAPPGYLQEGSIHDLMLDKVHYAMELGAAAVIFFDPEGEPDQIPGNCNGITEVPLPVVFIHEPGSAMQLSGLMVELITSAKNKRSMGKNVVAWIDNHADQTIVIGAHYDHLGWGCWNSRYNGLPAIHYGADDNASGVTGMLALAEWLASSGLKNKNYLFAAFSAEEKGLIGSRFFMEDESIQQGNLFAMLNYDMIGRVSAKEPVIKLMASGSSPQWGEVLALVEEDVKGLPVNGGVHGSDHHYFYQHDIPVLFFFNGIHEDYHKPSDVPEKINYRGLRDVVEYTINLLCILDTLQNLPFQKIMEESQSTRRSGQASLGIVPAHGADVQGVQVEEVLHLRPAEAAGMLKGDIIIRIDGVEIENIYQYMRILNQTEKGQQLDVTVMRNNVSVRLKVQL